MHFGVAFQVYLLLERLAASRMFTSKRIRPRRRMFLSNVSAQQVVLAEGSSTVGALQDAVSRQLRTGSKERSRQKLTS